MEVSFHFLLFLYHIWYKCVQLRKKYLQVFVLKIKQWNLGATWENTLGKMQRVKGNSSDGHLESQHFAGDCNLIVPAELAWDAAEISSLFSLFQPTQRILVRAVTTITPLKWRKGDLSASEHLSFVLHEKSSFVSLPAFPTTAAVPSSPWVWDDSSWHLWVTNAKDAEMSIKLHSHFPMTTTPQFTIKLETQRKQVIVGCSGFFLVFFFFNLLLWNIKLQWSLLAVPFTSFLRRLVWTDLLKLLQEFLLQQIPYVECSSHGLGRLSGFQASLQYKNPTLDQWCSLTAFWHKMQSVNYDVFLYLEFSLI